MLLTLARSSTVSMVSGRVADELAVEKAVSNTGTIAPVMLARWNLTEEFQREGEGDAGVQGQCQQHGEEEHQDGAEQFFDRGGG